VSRLQRSLKFRENGFTALITTQSAMILTGQ
jgi:hypothetical protein